MPFIFNHASEQQFSLFDSWKLRVFQTDFAFSEDGRKVMKCPVDMTPKVAVITDPQGNARYLSTKSTAADAQKKHQSGEKASSYDISNKSTAIYSAFNVHAKERIY